ncbi:MAG TPA: GNAT family N-acetyltransferase, partial [Ramlibacter sp.]|nr:GNAT family N-acetyltransferase [Ramlibacter sp.]
MTMLHISPLQASDHADWEPLARGYKAFYKTEVSDAGYEAAWQRLLANRDVHGLAARQGGRVLGIAHWMQHTSLWSTDAVYLQDLFVSEEA